MYINLNYHKKTLNSAKTKYGGNDQDHENDQYYKENYRLTDLLTTYKCEFKILNKKLRDEKRKFYRNRRLFEEIIDYLLVFLDENILKKTYNLSCKDVKKEILKSYDEDIKYN